MVYSTLVVFPVTMIFLVICCITDFRTGRIPNAVSTSAVVVGALLNWYLLGLLGLVNSIVGLFLMLALLLGPFAMGGIGGGDVKMMGAVGSLTGPRLACLSLMAGLLIGGAVMVLHLARIGRLREKARSTYRMFAVALLTRSLEPLRISGQGAETVSLPYSVPLAVGTLCALAVNGFLGQSL
jgi:prepilin peptidase CpaA